MSADVIPFPARPPEPDPVEATWTTRSGLLYVRTRVDESGWAIELDGELDRSNVQDLERDILLAEAALAESITIDLRGLVFMDSGGLRVIQAADRRIRGDRLRLIPGPRAVQSVFRLAGVEGELPFQAPPAPPARPSPAA
jgi:anti-anti-sigma factor